MCNCQNCVSEGYFEYVNGYVPVDCKFRSKIGPEDRGWELSEGSHE